MKVTQEAANHEPSGDPEHISYGKNYYWECSCGHSSSRFTTQSQAEYSGKHHEDYCTWNGNVKVKVRA